MNKIEEIVRLQVEVEHDGESRALQFPAEHFSIDPSELDKELCGVGRLMLYYGELEARLHAELERKEGRFKQWEAETDREIRQTARENAEKITEAGVTSRINALPERLALLSAIAETRKNYNIARAAHYALRSKRDCLIALAYREKELIKADRFSS